nr:glycosyltransferase [Natronocella acetinitrilica]
MHPVTANVGKVASIDAGWYDRVVLLSLLCSGDLSVVRRLLARIWRKISVRVLHVITGLDRGGAERQLINLVGIRTDDEAAVFSILRIGDMENDIRATGVRLYSGHAGRLFSWRWVRRLMNTVHDFRPDLVMGWMYHGNLAALLTRSLNYKGPVCWNVRHSVHDLTLEKSTTRWVIRAGACLSKRPSKIVYNSVAAAFQHETLGYSNKGRVVMPNGFDLERFKPDSTVRDRSRHAFGVTQDELLIGVVGRAHPMKNHLGWVGAFKKLVQRGLPVRCLMIGKGLDARESPLEGAIQIAGLDEQFIRLPATSNPERIYPGLDLLVMPSLWGEGFPNVVGEAMACGVPAVVTPVGDAADVVGDAGFVCASTSAEDIADAVEAVVRLGHHELSLVGRKARQRMEDNYGIGAVADRYDALFREVLDGQ